MQQVVAELEIVLGVRVGGAWKPDEDETQQDSRTDPDQATARWSQPADEAEHTWRIQRVSGVSGVSGARTDSALMYPNRGFSPHSDTPTPKALWRGEVSDRTKKFRKLLSVPEGRVENSPG